MHEPSDREIYLAACRGDREAFGLLAERHHAFTMRVAASIVSDPATAEDVAHKAWLNVCVHLKKVTDGERAPLELGHEASLLAWLRTVTRNVAYDELRRESRAPLETVEDDDVVHHDDVDERLIFGEQRSAMWRALRAISESCRELLLYLIHDPPLSYEAIAKAIGRPVGSIGPTRARCLAQLRALL